MPDDQRRLQTETRTLNGTTTTTVYGYDAVSNRVSKTVNGAADTFNYTDRYELSSVVQSDGGSVTYDYDFNGNLSTQKVFPAPVVAIAALTTSSQVASRGLPPQGAIPSEISSFIWDEQNRLTNVYKSTNAPDGLGGTLTTKVAEAAFGYPSFGWQMLGSVVNTFDSQGNFRSGETRAYGYGLGGELLHESIPGQPVRTYVNGGVDHPLWSPGSGSALFFLNDVNGSLYAIADNNGVPVERQRFDSYGKTEQTDPTGATVRPSQTANRLGYQGRTNFPEFGLTNFRNRWYSSGPGRFISRDPMGMVNGPNVFGFCGGDPVNNIDPMGTDDDDVKPITSPQPPVPRPRRPKHNALGNLLSTLSGISQFGGLGHQKNRNFARGLYATFEPDAMDHAFEMIAVKQSIAILLGEIGEFAMSEPLALPTPKIDAPPVGTLKPVEVRVVPDAELATVPEANLSTIPSSTEIVPFPKSSVDLASVPGQSAEVVEQSLVPAPQYSAPASVRFSVNSLNVPNNPGGFNAFTPRNDLSSVVDDNTAQGFGVKDSGHHVPGVRKSLGRPFESLRSNKSIPTIFPRGPNPEVQHMILHQAERLSVGPRQGAYPGTDTELFQAYRKAYAGLEEIRVDVRSPDGSVILGENVSPQGAVDLIEAWWYRQGKR